MDKDVGQIFPTRTLAQGTEFLRTIVAWSGQPGTLSERTATMALRTLELAPVSFRYSTRFISEDYFFISAGGSPLISTPAPVDWLPFRRSLSPHCVKRR